MKTHLALFLILLLSTTGIKAQVTYQKTVGGVAYDNANDIVRTNDRGYIIAGTTESFSSSHVYLVKLDSTGGIQWTKHYGGAVYDVVSSVRQTADGGYIISGATFSFNSQPYGDMFLIKTDVAGNISWSRHYGGNGQEQSEDVQQTADGGYIMTGLTNSFGMGYYDVYLLKTDAVGNISWAQTWGGASNDYSFEVQQTTDHGYIVVGQANSFGTGPYHVFLIKADSLGQTMWVKTYGGTGNNNQNDIGNSVQETIDGGYIVTGFTTSFGAGATDVYLLKTDSVGNGLWAKTFGGTGDDWGECVRQTTDRGYIITGYTKSFGAGQSDLYLIKTNSSGNLEWSQAYGDTAYEYGFSVAQSADGGYLAAGRTNSSGLGNYDLLLIKTDSTGLASCHESDPNTIEMTQAISVVNVASLQNPAWIGFSITPQSGSGGSETIICSSSTAIEETQRTNSDIFIYPNPFSGSAALLLNDNKINIDAVLKVYDLFGQEVKSIPVFSNETKISGDNLSAGVYFYRLLTAAHEINEAQATGKMVVY